jgi:hypothetical protein
MPNPFIAPALVAGGASLLGGLFGSSGAANLNKKTRRHQWDMMVAQQEYNDKVNQQQMDFQREVNQQNFDWNDPSNIRARVEAAGYNPYLYDKENLGSASGANLDTLGSSLGTPPQINSGELFGAGLSGAIPSFYQALMSQKQIDAQTSQNEAFDYNLKKQKDNDSLTQGGISAYYQGGLSAISQIQTAQANAKIQTVQSTFAKWRQDLYERNALDENGKPLVDENGEYVSNFDVEQQSNITRNVLVVEKLQQDILAGKVNIENMNIDKLLKQYDLQFTKPQEYENLKQSLGVMQSSIAANNASARASLANAYNQMMQGITEDKSRAFKLGLLHWDRELKSQQYAHNDYSLRNAKFDYDSRPWTRWARNSWLGRAGGAILGTLGDWIGQGIGPAIGPALRFIK